MISKLQSTIRLSLFLLLAAFLCITAGLLCHAIFIGISNSFVKTSAQRIRQQNQNVRLYQQLVEESSQIISTNSFIVSRLADGDSQNEINAKLDSLRGMTMGIEGITIYADDRRIYHTNNLYSYTSRDLLLRDIRKNASASQSASFWMIRHEGLDTLEVGNIGYFSYICEIHGPGGHRLGYLLVDTDIASLFQYYAGDSEEYFRYTDVFLLASDGKLFPGPDNAAQTGVHPLQIAREPAGRHMLINGGRGMLTIAALPESNDRVILYIPMNIRLFMYLIILLFLTVCAGSGFICWEGVKLTSDSIILPLTELYCKISHASRN